MLVKAVVLEETKFEDGDACKSKRQHNNLVVEHEDDLIMFETHRLILVSSQSY